MRYDAGKVLCERERGGSTKSYKTAMKLDPNQDWDYVDFGPSRNKGSRDRVNGPYSCDKNQNEFSAAFDGFLLKNIGRPWDDVYSEICQASKRPYYRYLFNNRVRWMKYSKFEIDENGILLEQKRRFPHGYWRQPNPWEIEVDIITLNHLTYENLEIYSHKDHHKPKKIGRAWFVIETVDNDPEEMVEACEYSSSHGQYIMVKRRAGDLKNFKPTKESKRYQANHNTIKYIKSLIEKGFGYNKAYYSRVRRFKP